MDELSLNDVSVLMMYVLYDAEEEAALMGEEFIGLTEQQIFDRIDAMPADRIEAVLEKLRG